MQEKRAIARAASVVGAATLLSRVGGLVRDQVTAYFFGASLVTDAFYVAWRFPNLLRRLLAEGALTAAFVPVFTENLETRGRTAAEEVFKGVLTLSIMVLTLVCALGIIFAPQLVMAMAPGFTDDPAQFSLTVFLTRLLFPYIFFMGLSAIFMGALNSMGIFAAPALGPFVCNVFTIIGAVVLTSRLAPPILGLAIGTLAGGAAQMAMQLPYLKKAGRFLGLSFRFRDEAIRKILRLMGPAALGAAVYQISIFINNLMASFLPTGSLTWLYYADRLMQFPLGIFAVAIATAILPTLARQSAQGDHGGFMESSRFALGLSFFITTPAMAGLMALSEPLVTLLFQRGEFDAQCSAATASALWGFALGLPALSAAGLLARMFYSRSDTKTPARSAVWSLLVGAALGLALMWPMKHVGLALASSLASVFNFAWLFRLLARREPLFPWRDILREAWRYLCWSMLMGALLWPLRLWALAADGDLALLVRTILGVLAGMVIYLVLALVFKCPHLYSLLRVLHRKLGLRAG